MRTQVQLARGRGDDFWPFDWFFREGMPAETATAPSADVRETAKSYELAFDLPGIPKEDIKVELNDGILTVSGSRKAERSEGSEEGEGGWIVERQFGRFARSFRLPAEVAADKVKASYQDGVLRLTIPKSEKAQPRQITIQ